MASLFSGSDFESKSLSCASCFLEQDASCSNSRLVWLRSSSFSCFSSSFSCFSSCFSCFSSSFSFCSSSFSCFSSSFSCFSSPFSCFSEEDSDSFTAIESGHVSCCAMSETASAFALCSVPEKTFTSLSLADSLVKSITVSFNSSDSAFNSSLSFTFCCSPV